MIETLDRWKHRILYLFLLASLVTALGAVLLFEFGGLKKVWDIELGTPARDAQPKGLR
jgi:hypothetical protein